MATFSTEISGYVQFQTESFWVHRVLFAKSRSNDWSLEWVGYIMHDMI